MNLSNPPTRAELKVAATEALDSLCWYDPRCPHHIEPMDDDDRRQPRPEGCACDNCFYQRDSMAQAIITLCEHLLNAFPPPNG